MNRFIKAFVFCTFGLAFSCLTVVAYWELYPYEVLTTGPEPVEIYGANVSQGGLVQYGRHWCMNYAGMSGQVTREFVDGVRYSAATITTYYDKGCHDTRVVLEVPNIPEGQYRLHTIAEYQVNPLRVKRYEFWTQPFLVHERVHRGAPLK